MRERERDVLYVRARKTDATRGAGRKSGRKNAGKREAVG